MIGIGGAFVAIMAPIFGAAADRLGRRKPWILVFTLICVVGTGLLWFARPTESSLWPSVILAGVGAFGIEVALIFYNAALPSLADRDQIGRWSGWGWGLGYAGGLASLALVLVFFVNESTMLFPFDTDSAQHLRASFVFVAVWYLVFSVPFFLFTPDVPRTSLTVKQGIREGLGQLVATIRHVRQYAHIVRFLIARLFYADGLATLFAFGGVYAAGTFDMDTQDILLFGITLNVTAGIGAFGFAWIDDYIGSKRTILLSLVGLIVPGTAMLLVTTPTLFWISGMVLGIFVGPVQAASRSYLARVAPPGMQNQMFGLFAFSGKATAFAGPLLVGWITFFSGSQRVGMSVIVVFLIIGLTLMIRVPKATEIAA